MAVEVLRDHPNVLVGPADAVVETLAARREELGINYVTVQQAQAESLRAGRGAGWRPVT